MSGPSTATISSRPSITRAGRTNFSHRGFPPALVKRWNTKQADVRGKAQRKAVETRSTEVDSNPRSKMFVQSVLEAYALDPSRLVGVFSHLRWGPYCLPSRKILTHNNGGVLM